MQNTNKTHGAVDTGIIAKFRGDSYRIYRLTTELPKEMQDELIAATMHPCHFMGVRKMRSGKTYSIVFAQTLTGKFFPAIDTGLN